MGRRDDNQSASSDERSSSDEEEIPPFDDDNEEPVATRDGGLGDASMEMSVDLAAPVTEVSQEEENRAVPSHNSGLTTEESSSSYSEYEEDLFPDKDAPPAAADDDDDDDDDASNPAFQNSMRSMNSATSSRSGGLMGNKSHHSVEVSVNVWRRTWEDRAKQFQKDHPQEYAEIERQMKQKDIHHIERERSQRIYENKIFANVDRVFKILGGAACGLCVCTIILIIILGAILKKKYELEPIPSEITEAPTFAPEGMSIITPPPSIVDNDVAETLGKMLRH